MSINFLDEVENNPHFTILENGKVILFHNKLDKMPFNKTRYNAK